MNTNTCRHCKKPLDDHTKAESFECALEIAKHAESELTDEEATEYFNEIKSGEFFRMKGSNKNGKTTEA